ncbi:MAG: hypothetical protein LC808_32580 [Actinobacteria bacterium]|nr:hypothetical protein [Actinomycetota bacterium]
MTSMLHGMPAGADAFSAGTRFFHTVAADLHPVGGGGGAQLSSIVPLADAPHDDSVGEATDNAATRLQNLRVMLAAARQAAVMGPDYAEPLALFGPGSERRLGCRAATTADPGRLKADPLAQT